MPVDTLPELVDLVRRLQLLPPPQLAELADALPAAFPEPRALAAELVRRDWLTPYQINQIFLGRANGLALGPYVLLERLGEGGMGEVFKARHPKLGRIVALKLIRKERLDNPAAVRRFHREVQAAAQLEHPHIVRAYDAGQAGDLHYFVMEYVEGTDLARLVKRDGPLPVAKACDYARQAALGLQHAFERGLVHRDIKPANLLRTARGDVVKVLDMGLARLDRPGSDDASTTLTQEGAVMGTPDYIAPEQARDSHTVDIRADLYSLGCTLYFLLAGRVPFPGGSLTEKLLKHTLDEPRPVEELRPETPAAVAAVVRRLMAKRPEDRYQTPAEAAAALASLTVAPVAAPEDGRTLAEGVVIAAPDSATDVLAARDVALGVAERRRRRTAAGRRRLALYVVGGLLSLGSGVWLLTLFLRLALPPTPPRVMAPPVSPRPVVQPAPDFGAWLKKVAALPAGEQVKAVAAELHRRNPDFDGKVTPTVENGVVVELHFRTDEVTDIAPVRALAGLRSLDCSGSDGKCRLADLTPLKDMKLTTLWCAYTQVTDLSPLKDMKLTELNCWNTRLSDLSPLKDMKLKVVNCYCTPVSDLSPLKDMKLTSLDCGYTQVSDLSPLKDMKLTHLKCEATQVSDLSPLKNLSLQELMCDFHPWRDTELLHSITTLTWINSKPAADFWKEVEAQQAEFDAWCKQVAALKPEAQVEAVKAELKKRNPGFDGTVKPTVEDGVVVRLEFLTDEVTDLAPVRALTGLRALNFGGSTIGKGRLSDLSPLKDLKLTSLSCNSTPVADLSRLKDLKLTKLEFCHTKVADLSPLKDMPLDELAYEGAPVSDLSPLKGMKLTSLNCNSTYVSDLSPLKDTKLTTLGCGWTPVTDLSPLKDLKLTNLWCSHTQVSDLSPLKDLKLTGLGCEHTQVSDLSPLKDMKITKLWCDFHPWRDTELLCSITTLEQINDKAAADFWKEADAQQAAFDAWCKQAAAMKPDEQVEAVKAELKRRNADFDGKVTPTVENGVVAGLEFLTDQVTDIAPVRALAGLRTLKCGGGFPDKGLLADLSPLKGMQLTELSCVCSKVSDLTPLKDMNLARLNCNWTKIGDLSPIGGLKLTDLGCAGTRVSDLLPLKDMKLQGLDYSNTQISDLSPLKDMPLQSVWCTFKPERDAEILRSLKTLESINGKPAAQLWKGFEAPAPPKP